VRSVVLYGANASGKSNLVDAFDFVRSFVDESAERKQDTEIPVQLFRLDTTGDSTPAEFEIVFVHQEVRYQYGFSVDRKRVHNAQRIFNTHDTTLLDTSLFRRDQVWFVEKDNAGASHLYPLLEYSPRKEEALAKGYLQGRYGALPFIEGLVEGLLLSKDASDGEN
jgi:AAA15 family ATPase/GTPase